MSTTTTYFGFPLIAENQSGKYLTHNDAIAGIDTALYSITGGGVTGRSNEWTAGQYVTPATLTDASTIAVDLSLSNNFTVTLGGNRTLGNPTNIHAGQAGQIVVKQDGTGSRTLAYASYYKFAGGTAPTLTTTAGATDILSYYVIDSTHIAISALLHIS
jgi:hypothetical protein